MKRMTTILAVCLGIIYYFNSSKTEVGPEIDSVKLKMSSTTRTPSRAPIVRVVSDVPSEEMIVETVEPEVDPAMVSSAEPTEHIEETPDAPWDEIKDNWKASLKEYLAEVAPESSEEIYSAYVEELSSYEAEVSALTKEGEELSEDSRGELDTILGQLDLKHEDKLKEILGPHYQGVTEHHQQFNTSIQYMGRGLSEVGVSL